MPCHPDRVRKNYEPGEAFSIEIPVQPIQGARRETPTSAYRITQAQLKKDAEQ